MDMLRAGHSDKRTRSTLLRSSLIGAAIVGLTIACGVRDRGMVESQPEGIVVTADGEPAAGVVVVAVGSGFAWKTVSGKGGRFRLPIPLDCEWRGIVTARAAACYSSAVYVEWSRGKGTGNAQGWLIYGGGEVFSRKLVLRLFRGVPTEVRVHHVSSGKRLSGVEIEARGGYLNESAEFWSSFGISDAEGVALVYVPPQEEMIEVFPGPFERRYYVAKHEDFILTGVRKLPGVAVDCEVLPYASSVAVSAEDGASGQPLWDVSFASLAAGWSPSGLPCMRPSISEVSEGRWREDSVPLEDRPRMLLVRCSGYQTVSFMARKPLALTGDNSVLSMQRADVWPLEIQLLGIGEGVAIDQAWWTASCRRVDWSGARLFTVEGIPVTDMVCAPAEVIDGQRILLPFDAVDPPVEVLLDVRTSDGEWMHLRTKSRWWRGQRVWHVDVRKAELGGRRHRRS